MKTKRCSERIADHWDSTESTLAHLWSVYTGQTEPDDDTFESSIYEHGLSFDYVSPGTFDDQREGYWRYQLSWGGPSDEIRFYASSPSDTFYRAEYWFLDWGDGAFLNVTDSDTVADYWAWFQEAGSTQAEYDKAQES